MDKNMLRRFRGKPRAPVFIKSEDPTPVSRPEAPVWLVIMAAVFVLLAEVLFLFLILFNYL